MATTLTDEEWATLRKALAIGLACYDGDGWYAWGDGNGWEYDDAEATVESARDILRAHPDA